MTKRQVVTDQLKKVGSDFRFWGRSEAKELPNILFPDETIVHALNGRYEKGFALFCATDQRLLLLDKKPFILCMEDMRYEMISEVDYTEQLLSATLSLHTPGRTLHFTTFRVSRLRQLTGFIQEQVSYLRHPQDQGFQQQPNYSNYLQNNRWQEDAQAHHQYEHYPFSQRQSPYRSMSLNARRRVPKFTPPAEPHKT